MLKKYDNIIAIAGRNLPLKLLALLLAVLTWWFVAKENRTVISFNAPVEIRNIPNGLALETFIDHEVEVRLQGPSAILSNFNTSNIQATMDLSKCKPGKQTVKLSLQSLKIPVGVSVVKIVPGDLNIVLKETERRKIKVSTKIKGWGLIQHRIRNVEIEPREIEVEALPEEFTRIPVVYTREIEVEPGPEAFTTVSRVELKEGNAKIIGSPDVRIKIHFHPITEEP